MEGLLKTAAIERKSPDGAGARPAPIQRFAGARSGPISDPAPLVDRAIAGTSRALDPATRAVMEPRFGYDFSQVRLHADDASHAAAGALDAEAFTVGDHILLGAGQREPARGGDRWLLAHELTHVVQQRSGAVDGTQRYGELSVSDPNDRFERAAETTADAVMSRDPARWPAASVTTPAPPTRASGGTPQRFLAGEEGHQGIEEAALEKAGLSKDEAHETYFGNWMRDFSQLLPTEGSNALRREFIKVLATGEFGRAPTDEELGHYLASEHVDRPNGGDSAESPDIDADHRAARRAKLSQSQRAWFDEEQTAGFQAKIKAAATASGLPDYIERAKEHAKRQIAEAARLGRHEGGEHALGNGLHAVEDYFAHSNFVEVALAQLVAEKQVPADNPMVHALSGYDRVDPTHVGVDSKGRPAVITGTSFGDAAETVGTLETLKAELKTPQLRDAFMKGAAIRYGWKAARSGGRKALGYAGGAIGGAIGAVGGAVGGLVTGAGKGAAAGWRGAKHWWSKPFAAIGGLFSGAVTGAGRGAVSGAKAGWNVGKEIGGETGEVVGAAAGLALTPAIYLILRALFMSLVDPAIIIKTSGADKTIKSKSKETVDPSGKLSPSHSQIAKDDIDHPLHNLAARLAYYVDLSIGKVMVDVWAGKRPVADAQKLVDDYLVHPAASDWWRDEVRKAALASATRK
jgi:hypothetical protein